MLLAALLSVAIYFIWQTATMPRQGVGIFLAFDLLIMIIVVERMIHTHYIVTADKHLIIHKGRFAKDVSISLDEIDRIDRINRWRIGGKARQTSLTVVTKDQKEYHITPQNEEDFIKCITKRRS